MSKVKYRYNTRSLTYEKVEISWQRKVLTVLSFLLTGVVFGSLFFILAYTYIDSPKEKELIRENRKLQMQFEILNKKLDEVAAVLNNIEELGKPVRINGSMIPPMRIRDFTFSSLSDAV